MGYSEPFSASTLPLALAEGKASGGPTHLVTSLECGLFGGPCYKAAFSFRVPQKGPKRRELTI